MKMAHQSSRNQLDIRQKQDPKHTKTDKARLNQMKLQRMEQLLHTPQLIIKSIKSSICVCIYQWPFDDLR